MCASCEDLLDCAFTDQQVLLFLSRQNNRHAPPREIEGKLVDFFEAMLELYMLLQLDMVEHGNVQQVLQSGLKVTVEIGVFENTVRLLSVQIDMMHQGDLILRQRSSFVGTQDIHRPKVLDRS